MTKLGRPCIGEVPMTSAQRNARRISLLKQRIADLELALAFAHQELKLLKGE